MSPWLRKSLGLWFGGTLIIAGLGGGAEKWLLPQAQAQSPATAPGQPDMTPEDLARKLSDYVYKNIHESGDLEFHLNSKDEVPYYLFSKQDRQLIGESGIRDLLNAIGKYWLEPQFRVRRPDGGEQEDHITVEINPVPQWKPRPVLCVRDTDGWKIDLMATYVRWANIPESQKALKIGEITGVFLPAENTPDYQNAICQSRIKQICLAIKQYTQDYDQRLPRAQNWQDAVRPYLRGDELFHCPEVKQDDNVGYAFNSKGSGKLESVFKDESVTVAVYETSDLRRNAFGMGERTAYRHTLEGKLGANYAFQDGHVKWLPQSAKPSFRLQPTVHELIEDMFPEP